MRLCIVVASFLISPNCLAGETTNKVGSPAQEAAYCQRTEAPSSYVGKQIRVREIYSYMFEFSRLKSSGCCPGRDVSIWVDFDEGLEGGSNPHFSNKNRKRLSVHGITLLSRKKSCQEGEQPYEHR